MGHIVPLLDRHSLVQTGIRPDMNLAVDWSLKLNQLSIYPSDGQSPLPVDDLQLLKKKKKKAAADNIVN